MNQGLLKAKRNKKDEFYTLLSDIKEELEHYDFSGKTVYCNCDDGMRSMFFNYFMFNFERLKLRKLICTGFGEDMDRVFIMDRKDYALFAPNDGDFRNNLDLLKEADVVVTNPPFSLFREYLALLMEYRKQFIIMGNINILTYKGVFELFLKNKLYLGFSIHSGDIKFNVPNEYPLNASGIEVDKSGNKYIRVKSIRWFNNIKPFIGNLVLTKKYNKNEFFKYDNYDAINIDKTKNIPCDYNGVMGVPLTFLDKYNPKQFKIVGFRKGIDGDYLHYNGKYPYTRVLIKRVS